MKLNCSHCGGPRHFESRMERLKRPRRIMIRSMNTGNEERIEIVEVQNFYCGVCGGKKK